MRNGIIKWFSIDVPPATTDHTKGNDMTCQMNSNVGLDEPNVVEARHWVKENRCLQVGTYD
ncbi:MULTISPECIES: hypothetical protein [unclassified Vibrio]|uniref:hypothetical protein n=1 Tax=unclassified Vibrio TaxID=2614977 RepID=UPI001360BF00|nr:MULTISPECIES: hypothetical protein [unclassified Vibrio]NAW59628.1 hypothetical protein [Vibrio sp. V36_P2S2PM302]NAX25032.1 hypothetical protein [Vibrio sp. V38_P2S17PM301]NAX29304.1 hypothetical protein [Vibrio sp. V37_P2S8PM304]